jgi:aminoglycoside 3-N-acetyltransferase
LDNPLHGYWGNSGLLLGDTVLVHSSMKRVFRYLITKGYEANPALVIDSLLDVIGPEGTILFPLFNFDFPISQYFSMISTPSQMGTVTEYARLNYEGARTGHPIYSFYVLGHNAKEFLGIDNKSGYGSDSPFAKVIELNGKIASVDLVDQNSMTMYHFVEESKRVDYRYFKEFNGTYEDSLGVKSERTYSLYVRNIERGVVTNVNRMGEILWKENLYQGNRPGIGNGMRTILAKRFYERTAQEIEAGRALETLYSINKMR